MKNIIVHIIFLADRAVRFFLPSRRYWRTMLVMLVAFALVGFALSADPMFAIGDIVLWAAGVLAWLALLAAQFFMAMAIFFLQFFIQVAGYNDYMNAPVVKLGWVMVRDLANMFFVVALLVIAFATILGRESYEWRKTMVKLVLVAIFINFSLLIGQVIIDAAHVFTITFLNAIAATACGNLIQMFQFNKMDRILAPADTEGSLPFDLFIGPGSPAIFAAMPMGAMGAQAI